MNTLLEIRNGTTQSFTEMQLLKFVMFKFV